MTDIILELTAHVVAAFVEKNPVPVSGLPDLIANVSTSLAALDLPKSVPQVELTPAVNPKKSIHRDYLISLEDGKRYKTLRRHLSVRGMSPEEYRGKWGLPHDYPMVAPAYSERRSELALSLGLGRKPKSAKPTKRATKRK